MVAPFMVWRNLRPLLRNSSFISAAMVFVYPIEVEFGHDVVFVVIEELAVGVLKHPTHATDVHPVQ